MNQYFSVFPSLINVSSNVRHQLEGNVSIRCPLRFGDLYKRWTVEWSLRNNHNKPVLAASFETQKNEGLFQVVINNVSADYNSYITMPSIVWTYYYWTYYSYILLFYILLLYY